MVYRCKVCGYIFDEKDGAPFSSLTECPKCKMGPDAFECIDDGSSGSGDGAEDILRVGVYIHKNKSVKVGNIVRDLCEQCHRKCNQEMKQPCEYYHYSDLGMYDMTTLDRPFLLKLMKEVDEGMIQAVIVPTLSMVGSEIVTVLAFYQFLKERNVPLLTINEGLKVMEILEKALSKM
ncbi:MAG: recombinase family protein [Eubacteriales bacterium]|nr:recombinase family protein [Eubacteriales bacterium]